MPKSGKGEAECNSKPENSFFIHLTSYKLFSIIEGIAGEVQEADFENTKCGSRLDGGQSH